MLLSSMWIWGLCWLEPSRSARPHVFSPPSPPLLERVPSVPKPQVVIRWPDGHSTEAAPGSDWLITARDAGVAIATGCLGGSCGACEIEVNGQVVRACIATVPSCKGGTLQVELATDPFW